MRNDCRHTQKLAREPCKYVYVHRFSRNVVPTNLDSRDLWRFEIRIGRFRFDSKVTGWFEISNRPHLPSYHKLLSPCNKNLNRFAVVIEIYFMFMIFSQTWLRYVWLMLWQIRLCLSSVTCVHPTQGFNFSGIFAPCCSSLAIWQLIHQKSRRSPRPSKSPKLHGVWLCDSSKIAK